MPMAYFVTTQFFTYYPQVIFALQDFLLIHMKT